MKKVVAGIALSAFLAAPAIAADLPRAMPVKAPPPAVVAAYNWTGFYIGVQGGYGWGDTHHFQGNADTGDFRIKGATFGGTAGYNFQFNAIVIGVEADYSWSGIDGNVSSPVGTFGCGAPGVDTCLTEVKHFGTVRGRAGFAVNQFLIYGTGGWAYGRIHAGIEPIGIPLGASGTRNRSGWTAGGGVEYGFTPNVSVKLEYLYVDFGDFFYGQPGTIFSNVGASANFGVVRGGLNWRLAAARWSRATERRSRFTFR